MTQQNNNRGGRAWWFFGGGTAAVVCLCVCVFVFLIWPTSEPTTTTSDNPVSADQSSSTSAPKPTKTPVLGDTRDNPLPGGKGVEISSDMTLTVTGVTRPADQQVQDGNMFNNTPAPTHEYVIVDVQIHCNKSKDAKCSFSTFSVKSVGSDGQVHDQEFVAGIPGNMEEVFYEFFGGATISGNLVFLLPKDDPNVVLFYEPLLGSPVYISLP